MRFSPGCSCCGAGCACLCAEGARPSTVTLVVDIPSIALTCAFPASGGASCAGLFGSGTYVLDLIVDEENFCEWELVEEATSGCSTCSGPCTRTITVIGRTDLSVTNPDANPDQDICCALFGGISVFCPSGCQYYESGGGVGYCLCDDEGELECTGTHNLLPCSEDEVLCGGTGASVTF